MSIQRIVFDRFHRLYGQPKTEDQNGFFAEYIRALNSTDPKLLAAGIDLLTKRHAYPTWPTIGEIVQAVNEAANNADRAYRYTNPALPAPRTREPTKAERARVAELMAGFRRNMQEAAIAGEGEKPAAPAVDANAWYSRDWRAASHRKPAAQEAA